MSPGSLWGISEERKEKLCLLLSSRTTVLRPKHRPKRFSPTSFCAPTIHPGLLLGSTLCTSNTGTFSFIWVSAPASHCARSTQCSQARGPFHKGRFPEPHGPAGEGLGWNPRPAVSNNSPPHLHSSSQHSAHLLQPTYTTKAAAQTHKYRFQQIMMSLNTLLPLALSTPCSAIPSKIHLKMNSD